MLKKKAKNFKKAPEDTFFTLIPKLKGRRFYLVKEGRATEQMSLDRVIQEIVAEQVRFGSYEFPIIRHLRELVRKGATTLDQYSLIRLDTPKKRRK